MAEIISNQFTSTINKGSGEPTNLKGSKFLLQNKNTYNNWDSIYVNGKCRFVNVKYLKFI